MIKPIIFTFILLPLISFGQAFTFFKQQTVIDTNLNLDADTFRFEINDVSLVIKDCGSIYKIRKNKIIDSAEIDFGACNYIYNMGYLLKNKRIYFLFFIKENGKNYATLYSFKEKNLKGLKRIHFENCFYLESAILIDDILKLQFTNKSYNIKLKTDLKNGNFDYYYD